MKRRNFLLASAGTAGAMIPWLGRAAPPCPPPEVRADGGTTASTPCGAGSYTTNFPLTENPISEGGKWIRNGLDWTNVRTTPGLAFGTNGPRDSYDDSYAYLSGFSADQSAQGTIYIAPGIDPSESHEVELLLRWADSAHVARGYECLLNFLGGIQVMRWNGAVGDFSGTSGAGSVGTVRTGDVFKATIIGNVISVYYNDALICSVTDSTFTSGNPGIGFFKRTTGLNNVFGFSSFTATSL
ncbi:MAG: hypothetical protein ACT4O5_14345 [Gammaproteobacteria bacterium]